MNFKTSVPQSQKQLQLKEQWVKAKNMVSVWTNKASALVFLTVPTSPYENYSILENRAQWFLVLGLRSYNYQ